MYKIEFTEVADEDKEAWKKERSAVTVHSLRGHYLPR
jgi:hypothetical protein